MAMPTNSKTWTHTVNNSVNNADSALDTQDIVFQFVRFLVNSMGCTVPHCCYWNGNAYAVANSDQWTVKSAIVWRSSTTAGARSWAVVKFPASFGGGNVSILIDCWRHSGTYPTAVGFKISYAGYNLDGSTSTPYIPTVVSGTEVVITPPASNGSGSNILPITTSKKIWNGSVSSDQTCARFWVMNESLCTMYFEASKLKNTVPGLTAAGAQDDYIFIVSVPKQAAVLDVATYSRFYANADSYCFGNIAASGNITMGLSGETRLAATTPATVAFATNPNPKDNNTYPLLPIGVWSSTNIAYAFGRLGEVNDMWWGVNLHAIGSTYPGDGSKTHIKISEAIVVPWNGSAPVIS